MLYSVTFSDGNNTWNTYDAWGLLQVGAPVVSPPQVETNHIEVPGMDGFIDLSEAIMGRPIFKAREYTSIYRCIAKREEWPNIISEIMTALHGKVLEIYIDNDFTRYYSGRVTVGDIQMAKHSFMVGINATVEPWRFEKELRSTSIFCPPDGTVNGVIVGTRKPAVPDIYVEVAPGKPFHITEFNGDTVDYTLVQGENFIPQLELKEGDNTLTIESTGYGGTSTFTFQGGGL